MSVEPPFSEAAATATACANEPARVLLLVSAPHKRRALHAALQASLNALPPDFTALQVNWLRSPLPAGPLSARLTLALQQFLDELPLPEPAAQPLHAPPSAQLQLCDAALALSLAALQLAEDDASDSTSAQTGWPAVLQYYQSAQLILLCPARRDEGPHAQALDRQLRQQLQAAGTPYSVLHGGVEAVARQVWQALSVRFGLPLNAADQPPARLSLQNWRSSCEKCSDPVCEHRLFSDLVRQRGET